MKNKAKILLLSLSCAVAGMPSLTPTAAWLADITNAATWSVEAYNSKFRSESAVTNTAAIIYSP